MDEQADQSPRSWLKPFLKPLTPVFREVVAMSFFVNMLALAVPVFTMQVYNRVVSNNGISTLQGLVVGMFLVILFDYILRQARSRILQTVALRVDVDLGRKLFRKLMRLPLKDLEQQPSAYWSSLFRDVDVVRNTLSGATALLVADLPFAILFLILIFVIAAPVAWVLLLMLPVFMFVAWRSANDMSQASGQERKSSQSRDSLVGEMISGRTTIKALALDRSMEPLWEEKHAENIESAINRGAKTDGYSNLGASLSLITSLLLTTVGALAIIDQNLTIGALIATNMLSGRIIGPLNQLVGTWRMYSGFLQAVQRLGNIFAVNTEREDSEVQLDAPKGKISIENVYFSYVEDGAPVVAGITVDIEPGGIHALVGRNGCGKTTLLKIIQGLYQPYKGRVTIDGADIAQFTRSELADWMGYVPQESVLFAGTVRDNITSRMPDASDEEVIKAATEAGVHHFIIDLPDGYATEIGEAGSRLSGGQRQRIAIARALVGNPPLVLLDEPSSSLDRHAETELKQTLVEIAKTRTVIIVSHSPTLLSGCDYLYALDRGKLALAGPAAEVLPRLFGGRGPKPDKTGTKGGPKGNLGGGLAPLSPKPSGGSPLGGGLSMPPPGAMDKAKGSGAQALGAGAGGPSPASPRETTGKVKASLTPRGKAPSIAEAKTKASAAGALVSAPPAPKKAATAKSRPGHQPNKSTKSPEALAPLLKALSSGQKPPRGASATAQQHKRPQSALKSSGDTIKKPTVPSIPQRAVPKLRTPGQTRPLAGVKPIEPASPKFPSKAQPTLRPKVRLSETHTPPQADATSKAKPRIDAKIAAPKATLKPKAPTPPTVKLTATTPHAAPKIEKPNTPSQHKPASKQSDAQKSSSLPSTTDSLLQSWAEGGFSSVPERKKSRKNRKSRGVGARVRTKSPKKGGGD